MKNKTTFSETNVANAIETNKKGALKEIIAKLSRGLMLPVAMLPIAGLFLGIGSTISNISTQSLNHSLYVFGQIFAVPGNIIFGALPVLFAIAIAISFTKDSGTAGLSALVGWLIFNAIQSAFIIHPSGSDQHYQFLWYKWSSQPSSTGIWSATAYNSIFGTNIGIESLTTSVFGGIVVGGVTAYLYNKFKNIQLPSVVGFFSGVRFVPIITFIAMLIIGIIFSMIWPLIGIGLYQFGTYLGKAPYGVNSFVFGVVERSLVPFGLHHAFYAPLWYTSVGGSFNVAFDTQVYWDGHPLNGITWGPILGITSSGTISINGDQSLWMFVNNTLCGKVIDGHTITLNNYYHLFADGISGNPGQYMQGKYAFMMFGLPAAALAMILVVPKGTENRKQATAIIASSALTSLLTGITEPIEFTFLFLAPWLFWGIHALLAGLSFWLANILAMHVGMTFSGGLLDFIIYGVLPDVTGHASNCYWIPIVGSALIPIYYFLFRTLILKFDIKTPGRDSVIKMFTKKDYQEKLNANTNLSSQETTNLKDSSTTIRKHSGKYEILAEQVIDAYGGSKNIKNVDACITKLRIQVVDPNKVNKETLIKLGARGVIKPSPQSVYAVFGNEADIIKNKINEILFPGE